MFREILFALGGNIALLAAVSWLIRSILIHYLSKDIETYKQTLKAESDKALIEHDTVFRSLHSKRADIIAHLYTQLVELGKCLNSLNNSLQDQKAKDLSPKISAEESDRLMKYFGPCKDYFDTNKLYFSLDLSNRIDSLLVKCWATGILTSITQDQNISSFPFDLQQALQDFNKDTTPERVSKIVSDFNVAIKDIENVFRTLVGITG